MMSNYVYCNSDVMFWEWSNHQNIFCQKNSLLPVGKLGEFKIKVKLQANCYQLMVKQHLKYLSVAWQLIEKFKYEMLNSVCTNNYYGFVGSSIQAISTSTFTYQNSKNVLTEGKDIQQMRGLYNTFINPNLQYAMQTKCTYLTLIIVV